MDSFCDTPGGGQRATRSARCTLAHSSERGVRRPASIVACLMHCPYRLMEDVLTYTVSSEAVALLPCDWTDTHSSTGEATWLYNLSVSQRVLLGFSIQTDSKADVYFKEGNIYLVFHLRMFDRFNRHRF